LLVSHFRFESGGISEQILNNVFVPKRRGQGARAPGFLTKFGGDRDHSLKAHSHAPKTRNYYEPTVSELRRHAFLGLKTFQSFTDVTFG